MDTAQLKAFLKPTTKAVILVHLYGSMMDVPKVRQILKDAGREDISIIEDVAQAHGAKWMGKQAGTQARFGCYSFYPHQEYRLHLGDGGGVFSSNAEDAPENPGSPQLWPKGSLQRPVRARGINSRLDEIQAAVLRVKLPNLDTWNRQKSQMVEAYQSGLEGLPVRFPRSPRGVRTWLAPLRHPTRKPLRPG